MAVCKALGARRILAIDVQQNRLDFAATYAATDIHAAIPRLANEDLMSYSKRHVSTLTTRKFCTDGRIRHKRS